MTTAHPDGASLLASPVRRLIVDTLVNRGELTASQLGEFLDLHVTTVRFHLDQLVAARILDARFVKNTGAGRPRKVYSVAPGFGVQENGRPMTPAEAGQRWAMDHVPREELAPAASAGAWLAKVGRMIDALQDWGYTPDLTTTHGGRTARVELARCPFIDLARTNPAVVCGIHRGLIAGAMQQFGESDTRVSLEPFVQPHLCLAHVTTHTPFTSGATSTTHASTTTKDAS